MMKKFEDKIIPFDNDKMEWIGNFGDSNVPNGEGKITDIDGRLLCEGRFDNGILTEGVYYDTKDEPHEVESFYGIDGHGAIVKEDKVVAGWFTNGKLDGDGVIVDSYLYKKGRFSAGRIAEGLVTGGRAFDDVFISEGVYDLTNKINSKLKVGTIKIHGYCLSGLFNTRSFLEFLEDGTITREEFNKDTKEWIATTDEWRGSACINGKKLGIYGGEGKWMGFEGTIESGKPVNGSGKFVVSDGFNFPEHMFDESLCKDWFWDIRTFEGEWKDGLFTGRCTSNVGLQPTCPSCGEGADAIEMLTRKCRKCGTARNRGYVIREFKDNVLLSERWVNQ